MRALIIDRGRQKYHGTYIEKRRRQGADAKTTIEMRTRGERQG